MPTNYFPGPVVTPFEKGFDTRKSPSVPLLQRGKQPGGAFLRIVHMHLTLP